MSCRTRSLRQRIRKSGSKQTRRFQRRPLLEVFERRTLLSTVTENLTAGILTVTGSDDADTIALRNAGTNVVVDYVTRHNGVQIGSGTFTEKASLVNLVKIDRGRGRQLVVFESSSVNLVDAKTHHVPHIYVHNKSGPICARMVPRWRASWGPRSVNQSGRPPRRSNGSRESVRSYFTSELAQNLHATNPRNRADRDHRNRPRFSSISSLRHRHRGSSSS